MPNRIPEGPAARSWSNFIVVPMAKNVITMIPGSAEENIFFRLGKQLPKMIPTMIGSTAPKSDQPIGAWPAAPRAIMVTGGPTISVVIATAPCSYSLP